MVRLDLVNIQTARLAETVAFYRDVLGLRAGDPPPPLDPAEVQCMVTADGSAIFPLSGPGALAAIDLKQIFLPDPNGVLLEINYRKGNH